MLFATDPNFAGTTAWTEAVHSIRVSINAVEQLDWDNAPPMPRLRNLRPFFLAGCIGAILFSSTSFAGGWCDRAFDDVWEFLLVEFAPYTPPYSLAHLMAEKSVHFVLFCIFGMLLSDTLPRRLGKLWLILLCGAVIGSCSEILQIYFPRRDPLVRDVFLNILATAIGIFLYEKTRIALCNRNKLATSD